MTTFQTLFGIKESQVKSTCVLLPFLGKGTLPGHLGIKNFSKGRLYSSGNSKSFTAIHTGIGAALLGDSVLYLKETPCQNIILFGACGLIEERPGLKIGDLVSPVLSYSLESFSEMLSNNKKEWDAFYADKGLIENFLKSCPPQSIKKVSCATVGSLKLEEAYIDVFKDKKVQALDMECAALFSASKYIRRNAIAFFYVTDAVNKKPFYINLNPAERLSVSSSVKEASRILCKFIEKNLDY